MRRRFRQVDGKLVELVSPRAGPVSAMIMPDLDPYQSIITGETIDGRAAHREHLKTHDMEEVGSERPQFLEDKYDREHTRPEWRSDGRRA